MIIPTGHKGKEFSVPEEILLEMTIKPRWKLDFLEWHGEVTREWRYAFYDQKDIDFSRL